MIPLVIPAAGIGVGAFGFAYKVLQELTDEEFSGTEFPAEFRQKLINRHWFWHGGYCPMCARTSLQKSDLSVDHRVPIRRGGYNSRNNARVVCLSCNCSKGDKMTWWDEFIGRGGKRPRRRDR